MCPYIPNWALPSQNCYGFKTLVGAFFSFPNEIHLHRDRRIPWWDALIGIFTVLILINKSCHTVSKNETSMKNEKGLE